MSKLAAALASILVLTVPATAAPLAFTTAAVVPIGNGPTGVVVADFNRDGRLDVAAANGGSAVVTVSLASPIGVSFNTAVSYFTQDANLDLNAQAVVVADFNGDGILDLAAPNQYGTSPMPVSVFLGNSDGTFQAQTLFSSGTCPVAIAAADFNGDGKIDLVIADFEGTSVSVLLGHGDGNFNAPVDYPVGSFPDSVAVGDFNHDGKLGVLVANNGSNTALLLLGNGDGTFTAGPSLTTGPSPKAIAVADLNGDGKLDAVVANSGDNTVSVLLGHGDGSFAPAVNYTVGTLGTAYPNAIALADMDGDGHLDIVAANHSTLSILRGFGDGTFSAPTAITQISDAMGVVATDFNGDGRLDLAVANNYAGTFTLLLNDVVFSAGFETR